MFWLKRKRKEGEAQEKKANIEVIAHKSATQDVINEALEVNKQLNRLLVENGFTIKIYLAAGGKLSAHNKGNKND